MKSGAKILKITEKSKKKSLKPLDFRLKWRKERDSNPRAIARKLISSQPRYDHFDILPYSIVGDFARKLRDAILLSCMLQSQKTQKT